MTEHIVEDKVDSAAALEELKAEQELLHEKAQRKRLETFWWGAVFVWAGLVLVADYFGFLPEIREAGPWSWIFLGAGVFGLVGALIRVASADLPAPTAWDYIWSGIFLIIGAVGFFGGDVAFPLALIVIGIAILGNLLLRRD